MRKYFKALLRDSLIVAFIISLFIHIASGVYVAVKKTTPPDKAVEVVFLDKKDLDAMKKNALNRAQQIVDQSDKRLNDEIDEKAKYLSRFNQKVMKDTKAANTGKFQNDAHMGAAPKNERNNLTQKDKPKKVAKKNAEKKQSLDNGEIPLPKLAALKPQFEWDKNKSGVVNPGPVSQTDDHLKDVEVGAQTILSSREFIYYSYYSRIKERLRIFWEPKIKEKVTRIFQTGRKIASDEDRITKLVITLDREGKLIRVQVLGESGLSDLDAAAVEAFQAAAPFPNPPAGIVDPDGTIKIRWDFIIEATAGLLSPHGQMARN
jgi:TonB family protein